MKTILLFLVKLFVVSLLLFALQGWLAQGYQIILLVVCSLFLPPEQIAVNLAYDSFVRTVPFLALMLATPHVPPVKRILAMGAGLAVFVTIDVASILAWGDTPTAQSTKVHLIVSHIWRTTGQWVLPFLLWFVSVYKEIGDIFVRQEAK